MYSVVLPFTQRCLAFSDGEVVGMNTQYLQFSVRVTGVRLQASRFTRL